VDGPRLTQERMKIATPLLLVIVLSLLAIAIWEVVWRFDHSLAGDPVVSPAGDYVAQLRSLPEGAVVPYGQGVFVRRALVPLWSVSRLVFAGYCETDVRATWLTSRQIRVGCAIAEGSAVPFPHPAGITVIHDEGV